MGRTFDIVFKCQSIPRSFKTGLTLLFVLCSGAIRVEFFHDFGSQNIFLTFYPSIALAALLWGFNFGLLATLLSALFLHFFVAPIATSIDLEAVLLFLGNGVVFSLAIDFALKLKKKTAESEVFNRSYEILSTFIAQAPLSIAMFDRNMCYLSASNKWRENYLNGNLNITGVCHYDLFAQCPENWKEAHQQGLSGKVVRVDEDRFVDEEGQERWLRWEIEPWHTDQGNIGGIIIFTEDLTDKVEVRRKLLQGQTELKVAHKIAKIGSWLFNLLKEEITFSEEATQILGVSERHPFSLKSLLNVIHPEDREKFQSQWSETLIRKYHDFEFRIFKGNEILWLRSLAQPQFDTSCESDCVYGLIQDITKTKTFELELRKSESKFRNFFETVGVGTAILDPAGRFLDVNERFCQKTGYTRAELIGKMSPLDLDHPEDRAKDKDLIARFYSGDDQIYQAEKRYVQKNGNILWVRVTASSFKNEKGEIIQTAAFIRDITLEKETARALVEEESKFRGFFHNLVTGTGLLDNKGNIIDVNDSFCEMLGYSREEIIGKMGPQDFDHPDSMALTKEPIKELLEKKIPSYIHEKHCLRKDGQEVWLRVSASPIFNIQGDVTHIAGVLENITHTKDIQLKLSESEERLRLSLNAAKMGIWDWDLTTNTVTWNEQMFLFLGYAPQSSRASLSLWENHVYPEDKAKYLQIIQSATSSEGSFSGEFRVVNTRGSIHWMSVRGYTHRKTSEKHTHSYGVVLDITEEKNKQILIHQTQRLEAVSQLAGGIVHDLNNLLHVISGNLELAQKKITDISALSLVTKALDAIGVGAYFNKRLLTLSQTARQHAEHIDINERIVETVKLLERLVGENIKIKLHLEPNLWSVYTDFSIIDSILTNIVINAKDAMPKGGSISIISQNLSSRDRGEELPAGSKEGDYIKISVHDTGVGMPDEVLKRVPEAFFTTKKGGKGTGLGLFSANTLIQDMGGFLHIESQLGLGSKISIFLPRSYPETMLNDTTSRNLDDLPKGDGELILVVEDEPNVCEVTLQRLESLGYAVDAASTAEEGIDKIKSNTEVALVLSDIILTGQKNGFDLAHWILTEKPKIKVVLNSGYNDQIHASENLKEINRLPMLKKPYSHEELARAISSALHKSSETTRETSPANT